MKFAMFTTPFQEFSMRHTLLTAKKLGFDGVEIGCREPHLSAHTAIPIVQEIKRTADELNLEIPALAGYLGRFSVCSDEEARNTLADFSKLVERAAILGAGMIRVVPGGPNAFLAHDYHYAKAAHWIHQCAKEAQRYGIFVVLEIHNQTIMETTEQALRLMDLIEANNVGIIHDAGNMYITDTDFGKHSVDQLGEHLLHVHIKDEKRVQDLTKEGSFTNLTRHGEEKFMHCLLGEGEADHQPLFDALIAKGYNGWFTMETAAPIPVEERMQHDLNKCKSMLGLI